MQFCLSTNHQRTYLLFKNMLHELTSSSRSMELILSAGRVQLMDGFSWSRVTSPSNELSRLPDAFFLLREPWLAGPYGLSRGLPLPRRSRDDCPAAAKLSWPSGVVMALVMPELRGRPLDLPDGALFFDARPCTAFNIESRKYKFVEKIQKKTFKTLTSPSFGWQRFWASI